MNGDVTAQRRWEAYDKLGTFVIYAITFVLGIQALGLEGTATSLPSWLDCTGCWFRTRMPCWNQCTEPMPRTVSLHA